MESNVYIIISLISFIYYNRNVPTKSIDEQYPTDEGYAIGTIIDYGPQYVLYS